MTDRITGLLPDAELHRLLAAGAIAADTPFLDRQVQPASVDLRLGAIAYRVRASFLPGEDSVARRLESFQLHTLDLTEGAVLETGCVYLVPLQERLALPADLHARVNPKSSTGRLDVFVRAITDGGQRFDTVPAGYQGPLYLEISPRSFPVLVRSGSRLAQLRVGRGRAELTDAETETLHASSPLVSENATVERGLELSVDLNVADGPVGYRARRFGGVVDVDRVGALPWEDFWEAVHARDGHIVLDPFEFYILASREAVTVPPDYAAEMVPIDPLVGEFRVHYAGFFDPGFGEASIGGAGSRAVLEVRSRDVPFLLRHGQPVCRLVYERLSARPDALYGADLASNYQSQRLKLSKHFVQN